MGDGFLGAGGDGGDGGTGIAVVVVVVSPGLVSLREASEGVDNGREGRRNE